LLQPASILSITTLLTPPASTQPPPNINININININENEYQTPIEMTILLQFY